MFSKREAGQRLQTIVVDLTPVLPGGENGGAKVFVLELLRRLGELKPEARFILLTQAAAHEELSTLDSANISRLMVIDRNKHPVIQSIVNTTFASIVRRLPSRLRSPFSRMGYFTQRTLRRAESGSVLQNLGADLLFCPFTAPTYAEASVPTVCTIYDLQYRTYPEFFAAEDVENRDRTFMEAVDRATLLVAISEYSRRAAIAHGKLDPNQIETIHLHVSLDTLGAEKSDRSILARLQLEPGKYLLYPANFWKHKNHEMLLTAFGIARRNGLADDVRLVCTGAPNARQQWLIQAVRDMGLAERVLFPGYLSNAQLLALVTHSAGIIFPSLYEGFGLPVIEAMANSVPVACSDVTSLPEVAGDAAIMFDPRVPEQIADAMISLAQDIPLKTKLIAAGKARARSFSDSRLLADQYWNVFERAIASENRSNTIIGIYPDGWMGPTVGLRFVPSDEARELAIEMSYPEWVPYAKLQIRGRMNKKASSSTMMTRGAPLVVSVALPPEGGYYEITFSSSFVPALMNMGDDQRKLAVMLQSCRIKMSNDREIVLFPDASPT